METVKNNRNWSIIILVALILIVTVRQFNGQASASVTVAADDEKVGVAVTNEESFFIFYSDITDAELESAELTDLILTDTAESDETVSKEDRFWYGTFTGQDGNTYLVCGDPTIGSWIRILTDDGNYLINSSTKKATAGIFDQIESH